MLHAKDVNERSIEELRGHYLIIKDKSSTPNFDNMLKAINLLREKGWKCVNISSYSAGERLGLDHYMHALLER